MMQHMREEHTDLVRLSRDNLVKILKENKEKHVKEYDIAIKQFRLDVIAETEAMLANNKSGDVLRLSLKENVRVPVSHEKDYDTAIRKYELSVDETIVLNSYQFDHYVMDNWEWKQSLSNNFYAAKSSGALR